MGTFLKRVSKESTFESIKNAPQSYLTTQFISTYTEFLIKPMEEYLKEAYDNFWCEPLLYFCLPNTYTFNVTIKTNKLQKNGSVQSMPDDVIHLPLLLTKKPTILELNTALQRELEKNAKETFPPMYAIFSESNTSLKTEYSNWEKTTLGACTLRNACTDLVNQKPIEVTFEVTYPAPPEEETVEENLEEEVPEPEKTHTTASIGLLKGGTRWGAMLNWMKTKNGLSLLKFIKAQSKEQKNNFLLPLPALQSGNALEGIEDDRDPNNYTFEYLELATQEPDAKTEEERNTIQKLWKLPSHISHSNFKSMIQTIFGLSFNETTLYPPFIMISDDVFKDTEGTPLRTLIDTNYLTFENINVVTQCGKFYNWNNTEEKKTVRILKRDFEAFKTLSNSTGTDQAIAQSFINGYYNKVINDSCRQVSKYEIKDSEWFNYILLFSSMVGHPKYRVQENTYEEEKEDGEVKRTTTNTLIFDFITLGQPEGVEEGDVYTISNVEDLPESTEQPLQFFRNISEKRTISKAK
jgi:hypothetical protein